MVPKRFEPSKFDCMYMLVQIVLCEIYLQLINAEYCKTMAPDKALFFTKEYFILLFLFENACTHEKHLCVALLMSTQMVTWRN